VGFAIQFVIMPINGEWSRYKEESSKGELKPIKVGLYNIKTFVKNNDTVSS